MTWRPDEDEDLEEDDPTDPGEEAGVGTPVELRDEHGTEFVGVIIDPPEAVWLYRMIDRTTKREFSAIYRDGRFHYVYEQEGE